MGDSNCLVWSRAASRHASQAIREEYKSVANAMGTADVKALGPAAAPASGGNWDYNFPVELGSNKMNLTWNRGEEPQAVATRFITSNGLDAKHSGDVIAFVMDAMQKAASGQGHGGHSGNTQGVFDFNYPVEVADGRRLTI